MRMHIGCVVAVLASQVPAMAWAQPEADFPSEERVAEILRQVIENDKRSVGIVAGWSSAEGTHIVAYGSGGPGARPLDGDSVFEIGSITKTFTATLLSEMALRGEVKLEDSVQEWLPANVKMPQHGAEAIRLRDLATHMSGMPRMPNNFNPADPSNPYADYSAESLYEFLNALDLPRGVGERSEYSNVAYGLLGHVLERAGKQDYETLVRERIFVPLKMTSTTITLRDELKTRLAQGHDEKLQPTSNWDLGALGGAGAIRSTVRDMLAYGRTCAGLDETPIADAIRAAQRYDIAYGDAMYSLAWGRPSKVHGVQYIAHNGGTGGYRSMLVVDPVRKRTAVVLSNCTHSVDDIAMHLLIPQYPVQRWVVGPAVAKETLDRYVGVYQISPGVERIVTRYRDRLFVQRTGQPMRDLLPRSDTEFFNKEFGFSIAFETDGGQATRMVLTQSDGTLSPASRMEKPVTSRMVEVDLATMDRVTGEYAFDDSPAGQLRVWREGERMLGTLGTTTPVEIFPESATTYFYPMGDATFTFALDAEGPASGVTLIQAGLPDQFAKRKP